MYPVRSDFAFPPSFSLFDRPPPFFRAKKVKSIGGVLHYNGLLAALQELLEACSAFDLEWRPTKLAKVVLEVIVLLFLFSAPLLFRVCFGLLRHACQRTSIVIGSFFPLKHGCDIHLPALGAICCAFFSPPSPRFALFAHVCLLLPRGSIIL